MPIDQPEGELARSKTHEMDTTWPVSVHVVLLWPTKRRGNPSTTGMEISADEFFGQGAYGAPLNGEALISRIDLLRRQGPPKEKPRGRRKA